MTGTRSNRREFLKQATATCVLSTSLPFIYNPQPARAYAAAIAAVAAVGQMVIGMMKRDPTSSVMGAQYNVLQALIFEVTTINDHLQSISVQLEKLYSHITETSFQQVEIEFYSGIASAWLGLLEAKSAKIYSENKNESFDERAYYKKIHKLYNQYSDFRRRLTVLGESNDFRGIAHLCVAQEFEQIFVLELTSHGAYKHEHNVNIRDGEKAADALRTYFKKALDKSNPRALPAILRNSKKRYDDAKAVLNRNSLVREYSIDMKTGTYPSICQQGGSQEDYECGSKSTRTQKMDYIVPDIKRNEISILKIGLCSRSVKTFVRYNVRFEFTQDVYPILHRKVELVRGTDGQSRDGGWNKSKNPEYFKCKAFMQGWSLADVNKWKDKHFKPLVNAVGNVNITEADYYGTKYLMEAVELALHRTEKTLASYCNLTLGGETDDSCPSI